MLYTIHVRYIAKLIWLLYHHKLEYKPIVPPSLSSSITALSMVFFRLSNYRFPISVLNTIYLSNTANARIGLTPFMYSSPQRQ